MPKDKAVEWKHVIDSGPLASGIIINLVKISFLGKMICKSDIWPRMIKYGLYRTYLSEPLYDTYLTPCIVRISHYS